MDVDYSIRPKAVIIFTVQPLIMTQTWFYNVSGSERSYLCEPVFRLHYWLQNEALRHNKRKGHLLWIRLSPSGVQVCYFAEENDCPLAFRVDEQYSILLSRC